MFVLFSDIFFFMSCGMFSLGYALARRRYLAGPLFHNMESDTLACLSKPSVDSNSSSSRKTPSGDLIHLPGPVPAFVRDSDIQIPESSESFPSASLRIVPLGWTLRTISRGNRGWFMKTLIDFAFGKMSLEDILYLLFANMSV